MALDKVVDSAVLDAGMTSVANAIRAKTGNADMLAWPDGFKMAVDGIQSGSASGIYMARVTPETDSNELKIQHNLGTTDILLAVAFAETLGEITPSFNGAVAKFWAKTDIPVRESSTSLAQNYNAYFFYNTGATSAAVGSPNSPAYRCEVVDENTFKFARAGSALAKYIAGVTYTIIVIAANAEV